MMSYSWQCPRCGATSVTFYGGQQVCGCSPFGVYMLLRTVCDVLLVYCGDYRLRITLGEL